MEHPNFRFEKLDICDRKGVYGLFEKEHPDMVVNFAAESHVDRSIENPEVFLQTNILGTQVAAAVAQDRVNGIINICSGRPVKLSDRVERFIKENGFSIKLRYGAFPDRPYDSRAIWGNDSKIRQILLDAQK